MIAMSFLRLATITPNVEIAEVWTCNLLKKKAESTGKNNTCLFVTAPEQFLSVLGF
jgi:hypothetical protein